MCIGIRSKQEQEQVEHVYDLAKLQKQIVWGCKKTKQAEQTHGIGDPGKSPVLHEFLLLAGKNIKVQSRGCKGKECNEYKPAEIHSKILPVVYYSLKLW